MLRYSANIVFLQDVWKQHLFPGMNAPFWSLSYEAAYYALFGIFVFLRSWLRIILFLIIVAIAGPAILTLFPLWLSGWLAYHFVKRIQVSSLVGLLIFSIGLALLFLVPSVREIVGHGHLSFTRDLFFVDYYVGLSFCLLIIGFSFISHFFERLFKFFEQPIRWMGSLTFALYLFHRPLLQLLGTVAPEESSNVFHRLIVIGGTFFVIAVLGPWCEKQKSPLRGFFSWLILRGSFSNQR